MKITFLKGIIGFEDEKEFYLQEHAPFYLLRGQNIVFVLMHLANKEICEIPDISETTEAFAIVTLGENPTFNLKAPLLLDMQNFTAKQYITPAADEMIVMPLTMLTA